MKRQDYVFGSTTSNIEEQTPEALNNGWVELSILYSRVLNGVCAALSQSTNIVSQEVANAIVGMGVALSPASDNQLLQVLQKLAIKATDFESPITASNKGATMKEIEEVVTSSFRFKGYVSTTQPTGNLVVDNLWINLSTMPSTFPVSASLIKKWNGSTWVNYGSSYTPMNFDAFRNNNDNEGYYWFGGQWKLLSTDLSTDYFRLNQTSGKWEIKSSVDLPGTPTCNTPSASNTRAIVNVDFVNNNAISSRNFTNCITEIPQDVKLELADGVLTLKAGSKVYVPNGAGVFDAIDIQSDLLFTYNSNRQGFLYYYNGALGFSDAQKNCVSGTTDTLAGQTWHVWYDTANNVIKRYTNDATTPAYTGMSLPLALITVSGGKISSIDEVFNGFGYIGSTVFVLPRVKALIPNGRNEDGTLKNINAQSYNVYTSTRTAATNPNIALSMAGGGYLEPSTLITYNEETNTNTVSGVPTQRVVVGRVSFGDGGKVTSLEPKTVFHAVDYNDFEELDNSVVHKTGDETIDGLKTLTRGTIWKKEEWDATQNPTSNKFATWSQVCDSNDLLLSFIETSHLTDGTIQQIIGTRKEINGTRHTASLALKVDSSGNKTFVLSDNPPSSSNGPQIATTYWAISKFLPLAGGTMTGNITTKGQIAFENASSAGHRGFLYKTSDGTLSMGIGNSGNSGWQSFQSFFTSGLYQITAGDGTNSKTLSARSNGTLTWDGKDIATTTAKSLAQNGYVKLSNGLIIQWGTWTIPSDIKDNELRTISLPTGFTTSNYAVSNMITGVQEHYAAGVFSLFNRTTTTFGVRTSTTQYTAGGLMNWMAIGY